MGRKNEIVTLISTQYTENINGDTVEIPIKREVFAEKKSVRQSEFYQAAATDFRPEMTFVVWTDEYNDETRLSFKGKEYTILRTFEKDEKNIELVCTGLVNKGV